MPDNPYQIPYTQKPIDITTGQLGVPIYYKKDLSLDDTSYNVDLNDYDPNQLYNINKAYGNAGNNYNKYTNALEQATNYKTNTLPLRNQYVEKLKSEIKSQEDKYKSDIASIDARNTNEINKIQNEINIITKTWIPIRTSSSQTTSSNSNKDAPLIGYNNPSNGQFVGIEYINSQLLKIENLKHQYDNEKQELTNKLNNNKRTIEANIYSINQGTAQQTNDVNADINTATKVLPTLGIADKIKLDRERYLDALEQKTKQNQTYGQINPYLKALI